MRKLRPNHSSIICYVLLNLELSNKIVHFWWVNKGLHISIKYHHKFLEMSKEMSKIDVEKPTCILLQHIVSCMSVTNTKDISGCSLAGTALNEILMILLSILHCHLLRLIGPYLVNILYYRVILKRADPISPFTVPLMNFWKCNWIINKFNIPDHVPRFNDIIQDHFHVEAILHPYTVHDFEKLEYQVVLSEIIPIFEQYCDLILIDITF